MTITLNGTTSGNGINVSSLNVTHTVTSGATLAVVTIAKPQAWAISSVKIGSTAFTKAIADTGVYTEIWYLVNPPSGSQTVTITSSAAQDIGAGFSDFSGTATSSVLGNTASTASAVHTVLSVTSGNVGIGVALNVAGSYAAEQTQLWTWNDTGYLTQMGGDYAIAASTGNITLGDSAAYSSGGVVAAEFKAAASGSVGSASGSASVSGKGASIARSAGTITGTSAIVGKGAATARAHGILDGSASVSGVGMAIRSATGTVSGSSQVAAKGAALVQSSSTIAGRAQVSAVGTSTIRATGTMAGTSSVSAQSAAPAEKTISLGNLMPSDFQGGHDFRERKPDYTDIRPLIDAQLNPPKSKRRKGKKRAQPPVRISAAGVGRVVKALMPEAQPIVIDLVRLRRELDEYYSDRDMEEFITLIALAA